MFLDSERYILGVVKRNPLFYEIENNGKIMDFFLLHLIYYNDTQTKKNPNNKKSH